MFLRCILVVLLSLVTVVSYAEPYNTVADLAHCYRVRNVAGSCVHCTTVMQLRWLGLYDIAEAWRRNYKNGEVSGRHKQRMEQMGLLYWMTDDGDERILELAISSRRGAGVGWGGPHCVYLVGRIEKGGEYYAVLIDNNSPSEFTIQRWDNFLREWRNCGGWAFIILSGKVPPPVPIVGYTNV